LQFINRNQQQLLLIHVTGDYIFFSYKFYHPTFLRSNNVFTTSSKASNAVDNPTFMAIPVLPNEPPMKFYWSSDEMLDEDDKDGFEITRIGCYRVL